MHARGVFLLTALAAGPVVACVTILGIDEPPPVGVPDASPPPPEAAAADAGPYARLVLADSPILYYRLDETSGPAIDLGTTGARGAYGSAVGRGVPGLLGDGDLAAIFPGTGAGQSGLLTTQETTKLEPALAITVECWVKADSYDGTMRIVSYGSDDQAVNYEAWVLQVVAKNVSFYSGGPEARGAYVSGATAMTPGVHYIAGTYDGARMQVYLDGEPDLPDGGLAATGQLGQYDTKHGLGVGGGFVDGAGFKGAIDEVAVYGVALRPAAIRAHYLAGR